MVLLKFTQHGISSHLRPEAVMKEPQAPQRLEAPPQGLRTKLYSLAVSWRRQCTRNGLNFGFTSMIWEYQSLISQFSSETWKLPFWAFQIPLSLGYFFFFFTYSLHKMVSSTFAHMQGLKPHVTFTSLALSFPGRCPGGLRHKDISPNNTEE